MGGRNRQGYMNLGKKNRTLKVRFFYAQSLALLLFLPPIDLPCTKTGEFRNRQNRDKQNK